MAGKKGITPSHVTKKQFFHPGLDHSVVKLLEEIEDSRRPSLFYRYSLTSVLFMVLVAILCGANDWPKVVVMAEGLAEWLAKYVDMSSGVPFERTFKNIMNLVQPDVLEHILQELASSLREKIPQEVISFDGQTARGTADHRLNIHGT